MLYDLFVAPVSLFTTDSIADKKAKILEILIFASDFCSILDDQRPRGAGNNKIYCSSSFFVFHPKTILRTLITFCLHEDNGPHVCSRKFASALTTRQKLMRAPGRDKGRNVSLRCYSGVHYYFSNILQSDVIFAFDRREKN